MYPLTGKSEYAVTNSTHFVNTINHERIQEKEIMVSFDVESLFAHVPIEDAVKVALQKTRKRSRSSRPHKPNTYTNCRPFKLCFTIHVFPVQWINLRTKGRSRYGEPCFRGYSQHLHGSCDEERAISSAIYKPKIWKRYVDDTYYIRSRPCRKLFTTS